MNEKQRIYSIRVQGHLQEKWSAWFNDWVLLQEKEGTTKLTGPVADQAVLHGQLQKIRDMGLLLIAVELESCSEPPIGSGLE